MRREDAYKILELGEDASDVDVKKSFRRLAALHHPDKNKNDSGAEDRFKKINEAYQVLTGKQKAEDDIPSNPFTGGGSINDFIYDFFGGGNPFNPFGSQRGGRSNVVDVSRMLRDINVKLPLTFKETVFGVNKSFSFIIKEFCTNCDGNGFETNDSNKCKNCGGTGQTVVREAIGTFYKTTSYPCTKCKGSGYSGSKCSKCEGIGYKEKKKTVSLNIPPLGSVGRSFLVKGEGSEFKNMRGNVVVIVSPKIEENGMTIENRDIISTKEVGLDKLLFGGTERIDTMYGEKEITIEKFMTPGNGIIIENCGVDRGKDNYNVQEFSAGNHVVIIQVKYPKEDKLTEDIKNTIIDLYKGANEQS